MRIHPIDYATAPPAVRSAHGEHARTVRSGDLIDDAGEQHAERLSGLYQSFP